METRIISVYDQLLHGLILLTVVFGTSFTKLQITGPLYLHDLLLILIVIASLRRFNSRLPFPSLIILLAISLLYLVGSLTFRSTSITIILRQYALYGYCLLYYLLFWKTWQRTAVDGHVKFLKRVGWLSVILQTGWIGYIAIQGYDVFADYNYYSPAAVIGLCLAAAAWLSRVKDLRKASAGFLFLLFLSATTGHSSAFLAMACIGMLHLFLAGTDKSRVVILASAAGLLVLFWFILPQFRDANANWRLIIWKEFLWDSVVNNYTLLGHGFGIPFFDAELAQKLWKELGAVGFFDTEKPNEAYYSTGHNFFLTLVFTIGLVPSLLILHPFYRGIKAYLSRKQRPALGEAHHFCLLALTGASVWAAFNVVLELPHSVGLFWLTYLSCMSCFSFRSTENTPASSA